MQAEKSKNGQREIKRDVKDEEFDFRFKGENRYFSDVILAQDTINTFLKEENPEERYKKFVESFPQLYLLNENLNKIRSLIEVNDKDIRDEKTTKKGLEEKKPSTSTEKDSRILEEINSAILLLKSYEEAIDLIDSSAFSEEQIEILMTKINARLTVLRSDLRSFDEEISQIDSVYNGNSTLYESMGVVTYCQLSERVSGLTKEVENSQRDKKLFIDKVSLESQRKFLKDELEVLRTTRDEIKAIVDKFPLYESIKGQINTDKQLIINLKSQISKAEVSIDHSESISRELATNIGTLTIELSDLQVKIENSASISKNLNQIEKKIDELRNKNQLIEQSKNDKWAELDIIDVNLNSITIFLQNVKSGQIDSSSNYFEGYNSMAKFLSESIIARGRLETELAKTVTAIEQQSNFNLEVSKFVTKGLEIIESDNSAVCPLCTAEYNDYKELYDKIINNTSIEVALKILIDEKLKIENELRTIAREVELREEELTRSLQIPLDEIKAKKVIEYENLKRENDECWRSLKKLQSEKNEYLSFFNNQDPFEFIESSRKLESEIKNSLNLANDNLHKAAIELNSNKKMADELRIQINKAEERNEKNAANADYCQVMAYLSENGLENKGIENLTTILNSQNEKINENNGLQSDIGSKLELISQHLLKVVKTEIEIENYLEKMITEIDELNVQILNFEQFILSMYGTSIHDMSKIQIDEFFTRMRSEKNLKKSNAEKIKVNYEIVENLKDDTFALLEYNKILKQISEIEKNLEIKNNVDKVLKEERRGLQSFLKKRVNSFFHGELINQLYKKIEPHPDYDSIGFECDFTNYSPRLQIYTIDKSGKASIPLLYFSTAQINILSLSVFLARALNAKDDKGESIDCIFIDDPIQSMDSINILSYIDLFRSVVINFKKQIILSTHEENFHDLLKRKVPCNLFNSKFIEFETFGKLKN